MTTLRTPGSCSGADGILHDEREPKNKAPWPDPMPSMLETRPFNAVWDVIKKWDINVPDVYSGYCGATGNHVRSILASLLDMTTDDWNDVRASLDGEREYRNRDV